MLYSFMAASRTSRSSAGSDSVDDEEPALHDGAVVSLFWVQGLGMCGLLGTMQQS